MDLASWSLGLSLIVLTIAIHTTAVVLMAFRLETRMWVRVDTHQPDRLRAISTMIGHIAAVALILAALHGLEGVLWASAYWWLGALDSFTGASVYSLASMTTFDSTHGPRQPPMVRCTRLRQRRRSHSSW